MTQGENTDRLLGEINERTKNIANDVAEMKAAHAEVAKEHHTRLTILEIERAASHGGKKALAGLLAVAGAVGGVISTAFQYFLPR